ncbi:MAG: hypothetical protein MJ133_04620 [Lachnospiraceae bacterium]|nr:hypothetical protein [Lachnospiraceae bacterium]
MENEKMYEELNNLRQLEKKVKQSLKNAPEGRLHTGLAKGQYPQYYALDNVSLENKLRGKYIRKPEMELAVKLAQKEYDLAILKEIEKEKAKINSYIRIKEDGIGNVYHKLPYAKRILVSPYILDDEQYIENWKNKNVDNINTYPLIDAYDTEKGDKVRSKSEKIIADKLHLLNIPYKYEAELRLKDDGIIFPDFTILRIKKREEVYLEHFGMMDNPEYCRKAIEKIERYEKNGIALGEKLFVVFESSLKSINIGQVELLLHRICGK